jgi:hypothetical protein
MASLLVKRDPINLLEREGRVEVFKEVPGFLGKTPLAVDPFFIRAILARQNEDLPVRRNDNVFVSPRELQGYNTAGVPALWSGYRSCITFDSSNRTLYRLKGVSFEDEPKYVEMGSGNTTHKVLFGGQLLFNAENERLFSDAFNGILSKNGLNKVMEYVGQYRYPRKYDGKELATSIVKISGDTRLDELLYVFEILYDKHIKGTANDEKFRTNMNYLMYDVGFKIGRLKKLMDANKQTWSARPDYSNAHIGNIVVYNQDYEYLGLGFVDFDASCDPRDRKLSAIREQQKAEHDTIISSALTSGISFRQIGDFNREHTIVKDFRMSFVLGFHQAYRKLFASLIDKVEINRFDELLNFLPGPIRERVTSYPTGGYLEDLLNSYNTRDIKQYTNNKYYSMYDVLDRRDKYDSKIKKDRYSLSDLVSSYYSL